MKVTGDIINNSEFDFDCSKDVGYENQSFHYDYNDEHNNINAEVEKLIKLLESSGIESINHKKLVAIIGITGCGKSTLLNLLAKKKLKSEKNEDDDWAIGVENPIAKISHSYVSETTIPNQYYDAENDLFFIDFAGLLDSKGSVQRIYNSYYMKTILSDKDVQFLLVIKPDSLTSSRGKIFKEDIVDVIHKLFDGGFGYIKESLSIVISHANPNQNFDHYINKMKSVLKEEKKEGAKQFTDYITKYNKISLFYQEDTTKYEDTRKNIIKNIKDSPYKQNAKINYAFGIEDELVLANSFEKCQKNLIGLFGDIEFILIRTLAEYVDYFTIENNLSSEALKDGLNYLITKSKIAKKICDEKINLNGINQFFEIIDSLYDQNEKLPENILLSKVFIKKYKSHIDFVKSIMAGYDSRDNIYEMKNLGESIASLTNTIERIRVLHEERLKTAQMEEEIRKTEEAIGNLKEENENYKEEKEKLTEEYNKLQQEQGDIKARQLELEDQMKLERKRAEERTKEMELIYKEREEERKRLEGTYSKLLEAEKRASYNEGALVKERELREAEARYNSQMLAHERELREAQEESNKRMLAHERELRNIKAEPSYRIIRETETKFCTLI